MDVDSAIDAFLAAAASVSSSVAKPPESMAALRELEATIAPLILPVAVRRFWERVDPATIGVRTYPSLHGPEFAKTSWLMGRDDFPESQPTALVQVAYTSHQCMSVELDQDGIAGGAVFEWNVVDGGFERRFNGFEDWLRYLTELLEGGHFRVDEWPNSRVIYVPNPDDWKGERERRPKPPPHPIHGVERVIERDILDWPEHWRRLAGLTPELLKLRGATHTIAELLATDPVQQVKATIVATVVSLVGAPSTTTVRVDDGTAQLVVQCPKHTTLLGPDLRSKYEFDVLVPPGPRARPVDPSAVGLHLEPDERYLEQFRAQYAQPAVATATAVRRA